MTDIHRLVEQLRAGAVPRVIARMSSGWAVLGDPQILRGYSLLLPDPVVPDLNTLTGGRRTDYLADMARLGDAVLRVTGAERINYEILGNVEPALHAHVIPRFADEPADLRRVAGVVARLVDGAGLRRCPRSRAGRRDRDGLAVAMTTRTAPSCGEPRVDFHDLLLVPARR